MRTNSKISAYTVEPTTLKAWHPNCNKEIYMCLGGGRLVVGGNLGGGKPTLTVALLLEYSMSELNYELLSTSLCLKTYLEKVTKSRSSRN